MDYSRRDRADRLASAYVLGTLRGPARRRFETLLMAHPALRSAVADWQERLMPLSVSVAPVEPPERVWRGIEERLFAEAHSTHAAAAATPWWQRLGVWRALSGVTTAAALAMFMVASQTPAPQAPVIVVLGSNPEAAQALNASFVASVTADGRALVLKPLNEFSLTPGKALQLWAVPAQGAPRSLGLVLSLIHI
jgi:anti-sigma-K factor RskA